MKFHLVGVFFFSVQILNILCNVFGFHLTTTYLTGQSCVLKEIYFKYFLNTDTTEITISYFTCSFQVLKLYIFSF